MRCTSASAAAWSSTVHSTSVQITASTLALARPVDSARSSRISRSIP